VKPVDAGGRYVRLAFFANRAIEAGEELTWNYSQGVKKRRSEKAIKCSCGEQYCREYL
jgi:SET domain-containing protein